MAGPSTLTMSLSMPFSSLESDRLFQSLWRFGAGLVKATCAPFSWHAVLWGPSTTRSSSPSHSALWAFLRVIALILGVAFALSTLSGEIMYCSALSRPTPQAMLAGAAQVARIDPLELPARSAPGDMVLVLGRKLPAELALYTVLRARASDPFNPDFARFLKTIRVTPPPVAPVAKPGGTKEQQ